MPAAGLQVCPVGLGDRVGCLSVPAEWVQLCGSPGEDCSVQRLGAGRGVHSGSGRDRAEWLGDWGRCMRGGGGGAAEGAEQGVAADKPVRKLRGFSEGGAKAVQRGFPPGRLEGLGRTGSPFTVEGEVGGKTRGLVLDILGHVIQG